MLETEPEKGMSDSDILALTSAYISDADSFISERIAGEKDKALRYYNGENPDGLAIMDGRSSMTSQDVMETVEWMMPPLMDIFTSGEESVSITPVGEEDKEAAETAQEWVNYVNDRLNNGYLNTYQWIKDALLRKVGYQKSFWDVEEEALPAVFEGLTAPEFAALQANESYQVVSAEEAPLVDELGNVVDVAYNVQAIEIKVNAELRIECIPDENVLVLRDATLDRRKWRFIAHFEQKSISDLRESGFDVPDNISGQRISELYDSNERYSDSGLDEEDDDAHEPAARMVWVYECNVRMDKDKTGILSWYKVVRVGDEILACDPVEEPEIYAITPIPMPHRFFGKSVADLVMDIQELKTALNRNILDSFYLSVNPRAELDVSKRTKDTVSDWLNNRPGGLVRAKGGQAITPIITKPLDMSAFGLLDRWDEIRENRTGVTKYTQGLDANSLNKTASGISQIMDAASKRIALIARTFAETGMRDKYRGILRQSVNHPEYVGERVFRVTGKQWTVTADALKGRFDFVVDPGIGAGNKAEKLMHLQTLFASYERLAMAGEFGPGKLVDREKVYNVLKEAVNNMGFKVASDFVNQPEEPVEGQLTTEQQLEAQRQQIEQERIQLEQQRLSFEKYKEDLQLEREQLQVVQEEQQTIQEQLKTQAARLRNVPV